MNSTIRRSGPTLTIAELRDKTIWIRDVLEPNIARHGPRWLVPDTVLELNSFFVHLLTDSTLEYFSTVTREALEASRVHRALLLITGRGTRWPSKLIEVCDALVAEWTAKFGKLNMIRPILYEKGGRLEMIKEERDMGRHELMMKWMGDPNSLVSPLRALEFGHLEFKPGQWWIHPLFAFHSGIIDSPDPHGGISADGDGAYAVLLTEYDEVSSETPDAFTYRCRDDDRGRFRLVGTLLPPKTSVRLLRSHTLHSVWSPPAGVRYDGLYRITKWSLRTIGKAIVYDVTFQRDPDQLPMREVRLHPTAEEVDDYLEYKRLREEHREMLESARRATLTEMETLVEYAEPREDLHPESETSLSFRKTRLFSDEPSPFTAPMMAPSPIHGGLTPVRSAPRHGSLDTIRPLVSPSSNSAAATGINLDGSPASFRRTLSLSVNGISPTKGRSSSTKSSVWQSQFSVSSRASDTIQEDIKKEAKGEGEFKKRVDSAYESVSVSKSPSNFPVIAAFDGSHDLEGRSPSLDHTSLEKLAQKVNNLRAATLKKDAVGSAFLEDLKGMQNILEHWRRESEELNGYVDTTLTRLEEDIDEMRKHRKETLNGHSRSREASGSAEPEKLEEYQKRYREREREGSETNKEWFELESVEGEESGSVEESEGQGVQAEGLTGGKWVIGDQVCWN